jgi:hypothetical protein
MPQTVRTSLWLLILSSVAGILYVALGSGRTPMPTGDGWTVATALLLSVPLSALWIFIVFRAYRRQNWARWVLAIFCVVAWLAHLSTLMTMLNIRPARGLFDLAINGAITFSIALLFVPASNHWYGQVSGNANAT